MTDIKIKWSRGEMVVHVESFLSCRSIAKVRKLFRIMNKVQPCTPDPEEVEKELCDYIKKKLSTVNSTYCKLITRYEECQKQIPVKTRELNALVAGRSRYKKSSEEYKMYSEQIKKIREDLKMLKQRERYTLRGAKDLERNKKFYYTVLEEFGQDGEENEGRTV